MRRSTILTGMLAAVYVPFPLGFVIWLHMQGANVRPFLDDLWILIQFWCFVPGLPWLLFLMLDELVTKEAA
jgi:hypothetical protein